MTSPWQLALGTRLQQLDPALATYFSTVPAGSVGRGSGTFEHVGTPRRWLWPVFALLARAAIAFPVWERDVPFEVVNVPGDGTVRATIAFGFRGGERVMRHEIRMSPQGLVDVLGTHGRFEATLAARTVDGRLELRSTGLRVRLGGARIPIPLAPRIHLVERRDGHRQRVEFTMTAPLIGVIYRYAGAFDYRIEAA
ncbi:DUF4166 domain-containing protein [Pseudolysinimonas yzui]|uniref:DUF4166 domain-containing protein n=1 Tax=Pseudolysinimonas yzui TaxID=2708254 RepID=A0A8J3GP47_9MICO|nr:DUF4166 domain-containing protein [Pseudolysinimonas yzui]GHF09124.1 hypothetical protein GCM10011600_07630 [Pseudolysinimonas yzui]